MNATSVEVFDTAKEAAHAAFLTAMLDGEDVESRLDAALHAYRTVLTTSGCLTAPHLAPTEEDLDKAARLLADRSEFPKYTGRPDAWRLLRQSARHVKIAYLKAYDQLKPGEDDLSAALAAAKCLLLAHAVDGVENAAGGVT